MNTIVKNNPGFFYVRYFLLLLFGIYALFVQFNNPKTLVYTLGFTWLIVGFITGLMFYFKFVKKKFSLVYLVFVIVDLLIGFILLYKSDYIVNHFSKFIGIIAIIMSFTLFLYRSKNSSNKILYILMISIFIFGLSLFFNAFNSQVFTSNLIAIFFTIIGLTGILLLVKSHLISTRKKSEKHMG